MIRNSRRRVVVTGMGAVTPLGHSMLETWRQVLEGKSGVGPISLFDASAFPTRIAAEVKGFDFSKWIARNSLLRNAKRNSQFALAACQEALSDAGLDRVEMDKRRLGLYFAAGDNGIEVNALARAFFEASRSGNGLNLAAYFSKSMERLNGNTQVEQEPFRTLTHLIRFFGIKGPASNCLTACAASAQAVGEGMELIRRGDADWVMAGGAHSMIHPFGLAGFCLLTTLSTRNDEPERASRPFDRGRDGFVLAEGGVCLLLENYDTAVKRKAKIYGEIIGYGSTADAYRLTDSHPDGRGAVQAMEKALQDSGLKPEEIGYINAHGTSTAINDYVETVAIKKVFGDRAYQIPVSSTKSMSGHLIAAAGALECAFSLLALRDGKLPPTVNYEEKDDQCDLDYIPNHARETQVLTAMSNSFGFGGQNIVLVVRRV